MCGISGCALLADGSAMRPILHDVVASQHPRGPDATAIQEFTAPGFRGLLGHNRLAVIDLSAGANQPMWTADERLAIVYNGEVYNYLELRAELAGLGHRFATQSDTEVVLASYRQWGRGAFERFNGPFAIALVDLEGDRLLLARDRFGVKPLYFVSGPQRFMFASTAGVMARAFGLRPSRSYVARGLRQGVYDDALGAPFDGMSVVAPGTWVEVSVDDAGNLATREGRFYGLQDRVDLLVQELAGAGERELIDRVGALAADAVGIRFRSDVPVALSLSGGLDSASIGSIAARERGNLRAFSFSHPTDPSSEGPTVARFAAAAGVEVDYVAPDVREIIEAYPATVDAQGAPFAGGSVIAQYLLYREVRRHGVKVLLGGQGGDEIFMGYRKFQVFRFREQLSRREYRSALAAATALARMGWAEIPRAGLYLRSLGRYRSRGSGDSGLLRALAEGDAPATSASLGLLPGETLRERQVRDVLDTSLPTLLRYEDRNSMAHGVESRLPFLDYRLVELAIALPSAVKVRKGYGKWILREAVVDRVPDEIRLARFKRGFDVRLGEWIHLGLGEEIRRSLQAHHDVVRDWIGAPFEIDGAYSDDALARRTGAFAEATSLVWVGRQLDGSEEGAA